MELTRASFIGLGAISFALYVATHGWPKGNGWPDLVGLGLFLAMMWWLLGKRRDAGDDAAAHQEARQSFAFRLGKALNRVRRSLGGRA